MDLTNLVSVWELEEASGTRNDSHGTNHLTDVNTVTQGTGKVNNCATFTAANFEQLQITTNSSLEVSGSFTIAAWVKLATLATSGVAAKWSIGGSEEYYLAYAHGYGWNFAVRDSGNTTTSSVIHASGVASTGTWYFITGIYDQTGPTIYVNVNAGTRSSAAGPATARTSDRNFSLGSFEDPVDLPLNGDLDQVVFFKRAITTGEETTLYNGGNGLSYAAMQPSGSAIPVFLSQYRRRWAA